MATHITQLIYTESGGFAGLQRGCTIEPQALPPEPLGQLQGLLAQTQGTAHPLAPPPQMPDMQVYTLELVSKTPPANGPDQPAKPDTQHWVVHYPADDVPDHVTHLIDFLHEHSAPLPPS
jgi:hypothetical protein